MSGDELQEPARRQPFQPFRLILTTGATYDIRHPDLIMVGRRSAVIGIAKNPEAARYDIATQIDLLHGVAFEDVPASAVSPNRPAS
jgi:hypothetical protein